jgi:hypothetical protein
MTKDEELKSAMALELLDKAKKSAERERDRQDWLRQERKEACKRDPALLLLGSDRVSYAAASSSLLRRRRHR